MRYIREILVSGAVVSSGVAFVPPPSGAGFGGSGARTAEIMNWKLPIAGSSVSRSGVP
jgi:hypothetical protein